MPLGGSNFLKTLKIPADGKAFEAAGTVERKYAEMTRMHVGVIQVTPGEDKRLDISGAAYGIGVPAWGEGWETHDSDGDPYTDAAGNHIEVRPWTMQLQADYEHPLHPGPAVGFVLGEMPGGRVTGWIDDSVTLTGDAEARLAIDDKEREVYNAVLSDQQKETVRDVLRLLGI
jgi:hypothetical protein